MPRKRKDTTEFPRYMKAMRKDVDKRLTDLKAEMDVIQKRAAKTFKEQPLLSLGVAFVLGMAIGVALANAGD